MRRPLHTPSTRYRTSHTHTVRKPSHPPRCRPGRGSAATETHRAAPLRPAAASPAAPRARSQGRGGSHHLVRRPPPAGPASPGTKGGQRRLPQHRTGREEQGNPQPRESNRVPPLRLTSRRREAPQPRRNSRMLLRHSPSVRGSGYTCKRRGGRLRARTGTTDLLPHLAAPSCSAPLSSPPAPSAGGSADRSQ